jgi:predicted HTH transcriptional regulator
MRIKELINFTESKTSEFKEKFDDRIIESAAAFASTKRGIILTGVRDADQLEEK